MLENLKLDRKGGKPRGLHTFGIEALEKLKSDYSLIDIWREIHPNKKEFSWHSRYDNISSRLDRIYLNSAWASTVSGVHIHPFAWSDHDVYNEFLFTTNKMRKGHMENESFAHRRGMFPNGDT